MYYTIIGFAYIVVLLLNLLEVKKITNKFPTPVSIIWLAILIPLMPVLTFFLCFFAIYRLVIKIILKIKYGKDFYGLLSGPDAFHVVGDSSNYINISYFMIRCEKYTSEEFYEISREVMSKAFPLAKFHTSFCKSFGYPYLIKQKRDWLNECMSKMKIVDCLGRRIDKQQFYELLNYHYNEPMPKDRNVPCHILIGTQPINWKDDDCDYYPVMFKIHHAVGDGISLIKAFIGVVADKLVDNKGHIDPLRLPKKKQKGPFENKQMKIIINAWAILKTSLLIFFLYPTSVVVHFTYKTKDVNILHNTSLIRQSVLGISSEQNVEFVKKIKEIKQKFPGTAFPTVLIAAFSASLNDYFEKNCLRPPKYVTISIPIVSGAAELRYLTPGQMSFNDINLTNSYSLITMRLPIALENIGNLEVAADKQVINRLNLINKEINLLKRSLEYQVNRVFMQVACAIIPEFFIKLVLDSFHNTTIVSIIAGPPTMTYYNGRLEVKDMIAWVPHLHHIGTSICIITYDDRLHIGVNADKALIPDVNGVQSIADNIYKYLDILEKEAEEYYNENS